MHKGHMGGGGLEAGSLQRSACALLGDELSLDPMGVIFPPPSNILLQHKAELGLELVDCTKVKDSGAGPGT